MSWNYRIIKHTSGKFGIVEDYYEIHEVYYHKSGDIHVWSKDSIDAHGADIEELKQDLYMMLEAFNKPILTIEDNKLIEVNKNETLKD